MKTSIATLSAVLALTTASYAAQVVATDLSGPNTPSTPTDEITFAGDVSGSDLLHGIAGTGGAWNGGGGSSPDGLNDGAAGGDFDADGITALTGKAWAADGDNVSFREFELGVGNGLGYDISEVQSIASWQGAGFQNQKYDVSVRYVGASSFSALTSVDYQPSTSTAATNAQAGSTKVNVTDSTGFLARGIEAIRFDVLDTTSNNAGGAVFSEIDVFGSAISESTNLVTNGSFELPDVANNTFVDGSAEGWVTVGSPTGVQDFGTQSPGPTDGEQHGFASFAGAALHQTSTIAIQKGYLYTLTVDVGQLTNFSGSNSTIRIFGSDDGYLTALAELTNILPASGTYLLNQTIDFKALGIHETGQTIGVALINVSGTQTLFDNVRLTAELVPAPAALPAGLAIIGLIAARRRRR